MLVLSACLSLKDRLYLSTPSGKVLRRSQNGEYWDKVESSQMGRFFHRRSALDERHLTILVGARTKSGGFSEVEIVKIEV